MNASNAMNATDAMNDSPLIWAEVDLGAIAHNVRELRRRANPKAKVMAVVKANGYGHGAVEVARTALANGAEWLGVARLPEAIPLREAGFGVPILVFGYTPPAEAGRLIDYDLRQSVYSPAAARAYSPPPPRAAGASGCIEGGHGRGPARDGARGPPRKSAGPCRGGGFYPRGDGHRPPPRP